MFLGACSVTYYNPSRKKTYDQNSKIERIRLFLGDEIIDIEDDVIGAPYALMVRDGLIKKMEVHFKK
jgi:hypothetical protein